MMPSKQNGCNTVNVKDASVSLTKMINRQTLNGTEAIHYYMINVVMIHSLRLPEKYVKKIKK